MTGRLLTGAVVAAVAATTVLVGGALRSSDEQPPPPVTKLVRAGFEEQAAARRTGRPEHYTRSERALRQALLQDPNDVRALVGLASLANTRHDFRESLSLATRARRVSPDTALVHGVLGDALIELGRIEAGFRSYERMAELKPSIAAYARIAQAQSLLGLNAAARATLRLALDAAVDPDTRAWAHVELGRLDRTELRFSSAAAQFRAALLISPGNALALDALAETEAARGNIRRAIALQRRAAGSRFSPEFASALGDLYTVAGNVRAARAAYAAVANQETQLAEHGVDTDLDRAMFQLEHGMDLRGSLDLARKSYARRPGIEATEVLSWALVRNGRCKEAVPYSDRALRFPDGHRLFHRAMIERCLGREAKAQALFGRALATDPNFSPIWARFARAQVR